MAEGIQPSPTRRYCLYALGVIFFANFLSYLDRQIVSALEKELREHFKLSDDQYGGLWTAFTIGYMVFAPIVGFFTDRASRPKVFAIAVFLWSLATIGSGLAHTPFQLYAARFCIGIGEAGCLVLGPTMLSDYFPKEQRGRALSIFFLGLPLGGTAGYIIGGFVAKHLGGWQNAFYIAGFPGILLTAVIWMLVDPPRGGTKGADVVAGAHGADRVGGDAGRIRGIRPYFDLLKNRTLLLIILAQAFAVMFLVPLLHFGVGFFEKERGMAKNEATLTLGIIALVAGALGNMLSGVIGDKLTKRGFKGGYALLAGIAFTAGLPFLLIGFTSQAKVLALPALGMGAFCYFLCMPAVNTQIANTVSARQRAMAYALAVFILHLLGDTAAPLVFGAASRTMGRQQAFTVFSFALLLAGACCLLAWRTAAKDEAAAAAEGGAAPAATPPH